MTVILKLCVVAVTGVLLTALLRQSYKPELAIPAVYVHPLSFCIMCWKSLRYGFLYIEALYGKTFLRQKYFPIILKVLAIAYAAEFTSAACRRRNWQLHRKYSLQGKFRFFWRRYRYPHPATAVGIPDSVGVTWITKK